MTPGGRWFAIGNFDGVHLGHIAMLQHARECAGDGSVWAATFWPHPEAVVGGGTPPLLTTLDERVELLNEAGADGIEIFAFDSLMSSLSPEEFVERYLLERLRAGGVVVGDNFRFGHRAAGTIDHLEKLCAARDIGVGVSPLLLGDGEPVSSSRIRDFVSRGHVSQACRLLGRPYRLSGPVVRGARRGRELGFPTANLSWSPMRLVPAEGVYGGRVVIDGGEPHLAAISVGTNPQFQRGHGAPLTVEAHLVDYDGPEFYGAQIDVDFEHWVRPQEVFSDLDGLIARITEDVAAVRATGR